MVVIGGLITSTLQTLTTLLPVPTLYAVIELREEQWAKKRAAKEGVSSSPTEAGEPEPEPAGAQAPGRGRGRPLRGGSPHQNRRWVQTVSSGAGR